MELTEGTLTPAYGRDYGSLKAAEVDFLAGRDFVLNTPHGTTYCSINDAKAGTKVKIRYHKLTKVGFVSVPKHPELPRRLAE